jgi:hypothetical protein
MGSMGMDQSKGRTSESSLTIQQGEILRQREKQYQEYFFPELQSMMNESKSNATAMAQRSIMTPQVNQAYEAGMQQVNKAMAQRGLIGSGIDTMANIDMGRRRAMDLNTLSQQAALTNDQKRMNLIQLGVGLAPQTTTATPMEQKNSSFGASMTINKSR